MKEKWSKGKHAGCVVSDAPNPHGDNGGTEYYGGYLVAESIPRQDHVNLIAAAPDLLEALEEVLATGLNGGNNLRLAFMAASQQMLEAGALEDAEKSETAVLKARAAIAKAKGENQ